ncbi:MAG TPA: PRC-barrel domain-containing protein [Acidimicrobiia bacterium]
MDLELREGSHLYSEDGDDLGTVREFVVEPSTGRVTHVLVEKGVFFTDDRVVPIETIDHMEDDKIVLSKDVDPAALPQFVREHFTLIDDETRARIDVPAGYMWRYPTTYAGAFPIYPTYPMPPGAPAGRTVTEPRTREALAEREIIGKSTPVFSTNGERVGTVSEVQVDEDGQLSHLVVDLGFLSDEKVLPAHWIERIESDGVTLAVSNVAVESLESIT